MDPPTTTCEARLCRRPPNFVCRGSYDGPADDDGHHRSLRPSGEASGFCHAIRDGAAVSRFVAALHQIEQRCAQG